LLPQILELGLPVGWGEILTAGVAEGLAFPKIASKLARLDLITAVGLNAGAGLTAQTTPGLRDIAPINIPAVNSAKRSLFPGIYIL
jgi:hypothetical protein